MEINGNQNYLVKKKKKILQSIILSLFMFHKRKKIIQIWNDMRVGKWLQN